MFVVFGVFWSSLVLLFGVLLYLLLYSVIGVFGLVGVFGVLGVVWVGSLVDCGYVQVFSGGVLLLLLLFWLLFVFGVYLLVVLIFGVLLFDFVGQVIYVFNQSLVFVIDLCVYSCLVGCYMLFYVVGSGFGVSVGIVMYVWVGWDVVSLFGVVISLVVLVFWWFICGVGGEVCMVCVNGV